MDGQQPPVPDVAYHVAGEGRETFTKFEIRDRIRQGSITQDTELAHKGTEDFRPASAFPELTRYFSLVAPGVGAIPASFAMNRPGRPLATAPAASIPSVGSHMVHLAYPFTGIGVILIILGGLAQINVFLALVVGVFNTVYMLAIIRKSSEGSETMPALADLTGPITFFVDLLKLILVTLVSCWPILIAMAIAMVSRQIGILAVFAAAFLILIYLPAAFALLARTRDLGAALRPGRVFSFMSTLGSDYVLALLSFFVIIFIAAAAGLFMGMIGIKAQMFIDLVGGLIGTWGSFYVDHLLGWGIYRHQHEL